MVWAEWVVWAEWECNFIPSLVKIPRKIQNPGIKIRGFFLAILKDLKTYFSQFFLETKMQAELFNIIPSFIILRLLAFKVEPVDVMSVINSEEPVNG